MKYDSKIRFEDNFEGNYFGSGDLTLSGTYKGTIKIDKLIVSENASFIGNITAQEIIVEGQIKADISAEKLHVMSTGKVEGDLLYRTLKIDEGGYLNSSKVIKMSDQKTVKSKVLKVKWKLILKISLNLIFK